MLEGTAFGVRHNLEAMREMGAEPRRLVAVGGGAKNRLWLQIVSDVSGLPQVVPERTIGASYGDAFLAGVATGIVEDRAALARDWVKVQATLEPDAAAHRAYAPLYDVYRRLYERTKDGDARAGGTRPEHDVGRQDFSRGTGCFAPLVVLAWRGRCQAGGGTTATRESYGDRT